MNASSPLTLSNHNFPSFSSTLESERIRCIALGPAGRSQTSLSLPLSQLSHPKRSPAVASVPLCPKIFVVHKKLASNCNFQLALAIYQILFQNWGLISQTVPHLTLPLPKFPVGDGAPPPPRCSYRYWKSNSDSTANWALSSSLDIMCNVVTRFGMKVKSWPEKSENRH